VPKTIYFVAGEVSGDNHGAALMQSLRALMPDLQFIGRGGPQMKAIAGRSFHDWIQHAGVVGLWEVLKNYGYFRRNFDETIREIESHQPSAVVLIDYPGFNLRLARALRRRLPKSKIIYYISPQVWAWNRGRIKDMARWLDLMLCIFPFEAELYNKSGLRTIFVGHPMIDRLRGLKIDAVRDPNLIALFPGSRHREVRKIFPIMLESARDLQRAHPALRFEIGAASPELARELQQTLDHHSGERQNFKIRVGEAAAIMQKAWAAMVASGSATLEAAFFRLPFVLIYKVAWLTYLVGRAVVKVDYLGMPNVLAHRAVVPEFIQHEARSPAVAGALRRLIEEPAARETMISEFDEIIASLGAGGAGMRAAQAILDEIKN
jgi:lipid-A-disaccharide synthase